MFGVVRADFDQIAVVAGDVMHLEDFRKLGKCLGNPVLGARLVASDGNEGQQPEAERLGIDLGGVALERTAGFELANPFEDCGRCQTDGARDLDLGFASVCLEEL